MKIFNSLRQATLAMALASSAILVSCEDHRMSPPEMNLPDRVFYALSDNNQIYKLNVKNTSQAMAIPVTDLVAGDVLAGIDFRPSTGQLYAVSYQSNLYQINVETGGQIGKATRIGTMPFSTLLNGTSVGFDFNPTVDRIRVVTNTGQNLRVHPETGAIAVVDSPLNGPASPKVGAVAYTNSRAGATSTALYDIDPVSDVLYLQNPPNAGTLVAQGGLGLDIADVGGFDISPDVNPADVYPIASVKFDNKWELDYVNLTTGKLQKLGDLPAGVNIIGIAIPALPVAYALDGSNNLKIFNPLTAADQGTKAITLPGGVNLVGIDLRPANGRLYGVGSNSKIYGIDLGTGAATELTGLKDNMNADVTLNGMYFGVDFNPVADRLRVISNTGQSLRIDVSNGMTTVDGSLKLATDNSTPFVTAVAYTNSYPGTTATTLFDIDSQSNILYTQNPPNIGTLIDPKILSVNVDPNIGFDIGNASGTGYAIFTVGGITTFYTMNLTSGAVQNKFGFIGPIKGLAVGFGL